MQKYASKNIDAADDGKKFSKIKESDRIQKIKKLPKEMKPIKIR